ncbi:cell division protein FtsL [Desulfolucanica intricata]|uniref:cell division protein FtsL n=1 Tax=Desulfolucanica intricata TaxID=1285191 RepID=UPI000832DD83|nr:cell division protein FtsL [Desulfolucanica intricata]
MVVAQNHAEKLNPADYNPTEKPKQKSRERIKKHFHIPRRQQLVLTGLVLLIFMTGILIAYFYAQIFSMGYQMYSIEKELSNIQADTENLNVEIRKLTSLDRIEVEAIRKLGMVEPSGDVVKVDSSLSKVSTVWDLNRADNTLEEQSGKNSEPSEKEEIAVVTEKRNWMLEAVTQLVSHLQKQVNPG